jgi:nuclear inhibitor of protein phosphatase 1
MPSGPKKFKMEGNSMGIPTNFSPSKIYQQQQMPSLYQGIDDGEQSNENRSSSSFDMDIGSKLGLMLPNPAPDVNMNAPASTSNSGGFPNKVTPKATFEKMDTEDEPKKKKYAKEQWPGRKPLNFTGV